MDLERGIAIVEKRDVIGAQRLGQRGVAFVAGRSDGVEPLAPRLQLARKPVQLAAEHLAVEQRRGAFGRQPHVGQPQVGTPAQPAAIERGKELLVNLLGGVHQRHLVSNAIISLG